METGSETSASFGCALFCLVLVEHVVGLLAVNVVTPSGGGVVVSSEHILNSEHQT